VCDELSQSIGNLLKRVALNRSVLFGVYCRAKSISVVNVHVWTWNMKYFRWRTSRVLRFLREMKTMQLYKTVSVFWGDGQLLLLLLSSSSSSSSSSCNGTRIQLLCRYNYWFIATSAIWSRISGLESECVLLASVGLQLYRNNDQHSNPIRR